MPITMKKLIITSILALAMLISPALNVSAADTVSIKAAEFGDFLDEDGRVDGFSVNVTLELSVPEASSQVTVLLTTEEIAEINADTIAKVVYMNQFDTPADGVLSFPIEKAKLREALGKKQIDGCTLYLKVGATDVSTAASMVIAFEDPTLYGDANGDGRSNAMDLAFIQRYLAGWMGYDESKVNISMSDVNGDEVLNPMDAAILARHIANWSGYETLPFIK